jgi:hypothetical protein
MELGVVLKFGSSYSKLSNVENNNNNSSRAG